MEKAIIKSGDIGIENQKFYQYKKLVSIKKYILIKQQYLIRFLLVTKVLNISSAITKMSAKRKDFDKTKYMSFLIEDHELLKKYNKIWKKVKNTVDK